ncbi:MAG TPA: acetyl-CoA acetyltransferase [Steroidobacteraceae bacterium]|nr:acetyl-CoA acetyltransferase [Steroidobacteraceae bacterium]
MTHANTPVIVGVGQYTDRLDSPQYRGLSSVELAVEAASRACRDALDNPRVVAQIDGIGALRTFEDSIPRYSTPFGKSDNFPHSIARRLGATPRTAVWASVGGDTPQTLVSEFCERIASGSLRFALVVGSEAISTSKHLIANNLAADWAESIDAPVDDRGPGLEELSTAYTRQHGLVQASISYAVFEHARRARLGMSRQEYAQEMGRLFAPFSAVAAANPYSTAPVAYTPEQLVTVTERNRMIADPYTRLLVARDQVNQAAAVLIASAGAAQELGIDPAKWVYLHGYSKVKEREIMSREDLGASPAARLACREALAAARISVDEVALFDLYSCFPIAVFNICDGLGLSPQDRRGLTVTGGLPYFGGPGNSYSTHAIASMVEKLREQNDAFGLIGANGGHMSKYAVGIYSTRPAQFGRCDSSPLQLQVDSWPAPTVADEADGPATIESYTVVHGKTGLSHAVVVGRLDGTGERFLANTHDEDDRTLQSMIEDDPLGATIHVRSFEYGNRFVFAKPSR